MLLLRIGAVALLASCGRRGFEPLVLEGNGADAGRRGDAATGQSTDAATVLPDGTTTLSHVIFVSSQTTTGNIGSLEEGDAICQQAAIAASLVGSYRAVLSTDIVSAFERLVISGPVSNRSGDLVATNATDFWSGSHLSAIGFDEFGAAVASDVFTGTIPSGGVDVLNCFDWTQVGGASSRTGSSTATDASWVEGASRRCDSILPIYCISQ